MAEDTSAELNETPESGNSESDDTVHADEYELGELAPAIVTTAKLWKPDDLKKEDSNLIGRIQKLVGDISTTDEAARRFQVLQVWEERHMDRGYQFLDGDGSKGWRIPGASGDNPVESANDSGLYPTNILSSQGDIITSALNRGTISVKFSPIRSKDPADAQCADEANKYAKIWNSANNSRLLQSNVMDLAWTDPRGVLWTRTIADRRFGRTDKGEIRRAEVTTPHGVLESKLPMMVDRLEDCSYVQIFEEMDYALARAAWPWMGKKITPSWGTFGELEFERIARINTRIGMVGKYVTGTSGLREATIGYMWFRPSMYFSDSFGDSQRDFLLENFPDGLFVIMAGPNLVCCWNESMDDHLAIGMFTRGFGQNRRSLSSSDVPIQKRINLWADLWDRFVRTAIPITLLDDQAFDTEAISQLEASPRRFVPVSLDAGAQQTMQSVVGQTPAPAPIQGMMEMFQYYLGPLIQSIDGATPALFGSAEGGSDNTVGATQIRLQQSLERIGKCWVIVNQMFAKAISQAVHCCAENGNDQLTGYGDIQVDPANLKGNFYCEPETITTIPQSGAQREARIMQVLTLAAQSNEIATVVGRPSNAREIVKGLNIDDVITVDEADWEDAALEDIGKLLESEPLLNPGYQELSQQIDELSGLHDHAKNLATQLINTGGTPSPEHIQQGTAMEAQLGQMQEQLQQMPKYLPSIEIAQDDSQDHGTIADTIKSWFGQREGRSLRSAASREPEGGENWKKWQNVYLYWKGNCDVRDKLAQSMQPKPIPKLSLSGKMAPETITELLAAAGIQTPPQAQDSPEVEQEQISRTPYSETKTRIKRRL